MEEGPAIPPVAFYPPPSVPYPVYVAPPAPAAPAASSSQNCREYQTTITIDGQSHPATGTVCMQSDGK